MLSAIAKLQPTDVISQLKSYNVTLTDITLHAQPTSKEYTFNMEYSVPDPKYPVTYNATYDPTKSPAWLMTSWNGNNKPEKYQTNSLTDRVAKYATVPVVVDEASLKSAMEGNYLVVSFRVVPASVPKQYMYLKDCDGKAYINTNSGKLEKTVWENFHPTRNAAVRVKKIREEVYFINADGMYHVSKEAQTMGGSVATKTGDVTGQADQVITYLNYRKVN